MARKIPLREHLCSNCLHSWWRWVKGERAQCGKCGSYDLVVMTTRRPPKRRYTP